MTREDQVRTLLRFHSTVVNPLQTIERGDGDGCPLMPAEYRNFPVWRELERSLRLMRRTERTLWWHTFERYYSPKLRRKLVPFKYGQPILSPCEALYGESASKAKRAKNRVYTELRLVEYWSPRVNLKLADQGLAWLAGEMFKGGPLFLPADLLEAA